MPEILLAESAGFCFGVQRAVDMVYEQVRRHAGRRRIFTLGPLIHNPQVIDELERAGVRAITIDDFKRAGGGTPDDGGTGDISDGIVIIRSHGVSRHVIETLEEKGIEYVDATCPFVDRIHRIVCREEEAGRRIIVVGNPEHPEVRGICGWCREPYTVLEDTQKAESFEGDPAVEYSIVAQTTFRENKFLQVVDILRKKGYNTNVLNTICNATAKRQKEAEEIASKVDVMLVIGGAESSNTQKLFEICNTCCTNTYYVQVPDDVDLNRVRSVKTVGITAGASTPNNIIKEVSNHVRRTDV